MRMVNVKDDRVCPLLSIASLIKDGPDHWHPCVKECGFARQEGGVWWCAFVELAHCAEYMEKGPSIFD